ncbi:MAG: hypothetical protein HYV67_03925 [Candidatus Taylorbacteria bacterium]|nr:hypothetical protein [Candidatus Taylorbacteria bacterium]
MFNLLPQEEQQAINREYRLRLAATSLLFLAALSAVASVALLPSLFLSFQKEAVILKRADVLKAEIATGGRDNSASLLKLTGQKAAVFKEERPVFYFYELIRDITRQKTAGIKIMGVSIKRAEGGSPAVAVLGVAKDREALLSFERTLKREKTFAEVSVPVSNFVSAADINFSIMAKTK